MADDFSPQMRLAFRATPGVNPAEERSIGRTIWMGTSRFISFLGGAVSPFAEAWNIAGGPGGQGGVVLANFMQKFGAPAIQHIGEKVYVPRVQASPYAGIQAFNTTMGNNIRISSETTQSLENVLSTRYDAMTSSSADVN